MKNEPREMDGMRDASVLNKGFSIEFVTMSHNSPPHRHRTMEILYILNGHADITIEGKEYHLDPLDFTIRSFFTENSGSCMAVPLVCCEK